MLNEFTIEGTINRFEVFTTKAGKDIITMVLDVEGKFPQYVPIKLFGGLGEKWSKMGHGHLVRVFGKIGGREWNGKVYGENVATTVEMVESKASSLPTASDGDDNIPF